ERRACRVQDERRRIARRRECRRVAILRARGGGQRGGRKSEGPDQENSSAHPAPPRGDGYEALDAVSPATAGDRSSRQKQTATGTIEARMITTVSVTSCARERLTGRSSRRVARGVAASKAAI